VEAYADKRNRKSLAVLAHLGLSVIGENKNGISYRLRGSYAELKSRYA
jgi:RimJ/RimL family protein N-acetyltransferase